MVSVFEDRLIAAFPKNTWYHIVRGVSTGVRNADRFVETSPMLRHVLGKDLQGHIRRLGVLTTLEAMCKSGELPFTARASKMPKGVWHWLDIKSDRFIAHLARTVSASALPDDTPNRQTECLRNTYDMFDDGRIPPMETVLEEATVRYSYITFGIDCSGSLTHACIGMPSSDDTGWLAHVNIFRCAAGASYVPPPSPTQPDPTQKLRLRQSVDELIELNKNDKEQSA